MQKVQRRLVLKKKYIYRVQKKKGISESCRKVEAIYNLIKEFGQKQYDVTTDLGRTKSYAIKATISVHYLPHQRIKHNSNNLYNYRGEEQKRQNVEMMSYQDVKF